MISAIAVAMSLVTNPNLLALLQEPVAAPVPVNAATAPGADPKTTLNTFCQRYCKRAISKTDILYTTHKIGDVLQAVVKLNCLDGIEFAGEVATNQKDAEKNAAKQALQNYSSEMAMLPAANKTTKKRKAPGDSMTSFGMAAPALTVDPTTQNAKVALNTGLMRILHRALTKEDVQYNTVQTALGFQCTISLPSLPREWSTYAWAGEVANKKKDAEEHAARHAVEALRADPIMAKAMDTPPNKVAKTGGGGKGYAPSYGGGCYGGYGGMQMSIFNKGFKGGWKGYGKGTPCCGGGMGMPLTRERITQDMVTGTILDWKDRYGWVNLHEPVDHPQATRNSGRVYLNMKDWQQPDSPPAEGTLIQMHVYADQSGLGAEEVSALG